MNSSAKYTLIFLISVILNVGCQPSSKIKIDEDISNKPNIGSIVFKDLKNDNINIIRSNGTGLSIIAKGAYKLSISPNRRFLAIYYGKNEKGWIKYDNSIEIYDSHTGSRFNIQNVYNEGLDDLAWSNNSKHLLFRSHTDEAVLKKFNIENKEVVSEIKTTSHPVYSFGFAKNNKYILIESSNPDFPASSNLYIRYPNDNKSLSEHMSLTKESFQSLIFSDFEEIIFHVYDNKIRYSPKEKKPLVIEKGDLIIDGNIIYDYRGKYSPDFGYHGISYAEWISDDHVVFEFGPQIFVINTENRKVSLLAEGSHPIALK